MVLVIFCTFLALLPSTWTPHDFVRLIRADFPCIGGNRVSDFSVLLAYAALGLALNTSHGMFAWKELVLISSSWLAMIGFGYWAFNPRVSRSRSDLSQQSAVCVAASICVFFSVILFCNPIVMQQRLGLDQKLMNYCLALVVFFSVVLFFGIFRQKTKGVRISAFAIFVLLFLCRIFTIRSSPSPFFDVFTLDTQASDYLLKGLNPYSQHYPDIYNGAYDYAPGYTYWPAVLYWQTLSRQFFGDIRYGYVIADALTVFSIRSIIADLKWSENIKKLIPLLWLGFPVSFFVLDESWVDVPLVACAALFLALAVKRRWWSAGIFLGLFCSVKQYAFIFAIYSALFVLWQNPVHWQWRSFLKLVGSAFAIMLLMFIPFVIWDWHGFYFNTVASVIHQKIRWDSLSFVPAFIRLHWFEMSFQQSLLLYGAAFTFSIYILYRYSSKIRDYGALGFASTFTYGVIFLFGKTAFCNYYYFMAFFVLFYFYGRSSITRQGGGLPN
jgi:hypothetical protein